MNVLFCKSRIAWRSSSFVFMTMGPCQATGSAIGAPERLSEQPPARVWHYEFSGCSLELFLFPDVSSGAEKALSWSAKPREPDSSGIDPLCTRISADG